MSNSTRDRIVAAFDRELEASPVPPALRNQSVHAAVALPRHQPRQSRLLGVVAVLLALAVVVTLVVSSHLLRTHQIPAGSRSPSPSQRAAAPTLLCFTAPPPDWATAMAHVAATLDGVNFDPGAIDEQDGVVYGGARTGSRPMIVSVALSTGRMTAVAPMSASGFGWMTYADGWLVWTQPGSLDLQLWNARTHEILQVATGPQMEGTSYLTGALLDPVIGHGYMAWSQPVSSQSAELRVYELATGHVTILDSGDVGSPVFAGADLVWTKRDAGAANPHFVFADANTLQPVAVPTELRDPREIGFVAGSSDRLVWTGTPGSPDGTWFVDDLAARTIRTYTASGHYAQFPQVAGPYLVWFGADKNSIVDLRSGAGFDLPLPGGVEAVGDTIVVDRLSGPKGSVSRTVVSVLHPSRLSSLGPCTA
jgi:hypothetical protein